VGSRRSGRRAGRQSSECRSLADGRRQSASASAATELEFGTGRWRTVILETESLGEPLKMFDECTYDSLRDWGVDPDMDEKITAPLGARSVAVAQCGRL